jgi:hypothetical protein
VTSARTPPGPLYAAIGLGAFLLFLVQPMAARFILPWFGGGPTVWSTCLLFFQVALLAGYGYAHVSRRLSLKRQAQLHLALLFLAALTLPIAPSAAWKPVDATAPSARILLLLAATVGAPYLVLAATAPLMQDWFARATSGAAPYRLYAWSNAGSLVALLAYPVAVEPFLPLRAQAVAWSALFVAFCLVCAWSAIRLIRLAESNPAPGDDTASETPVTAGDRIMWVLLSACGSGLLLAVTNQLCQNVAVVPLLWIVPLTGYLLTFILCFANAYRRSIWAPLLLVAAGGAAWVWRMPIENFALQVASVFGVLIAGCMVMHGELVRIRPGARRLTSFYLAIALGGSLGGSCVALIAPAVLDRLWEFPFFAMLSVLLLLIALFRDPASRLRAGARPIVWAGMTVAFCAAATAFVLPSKSDTGIVIARARNFYGILAVEDDPPGALEPRMRRLHNGRILHGAQFLDSEKQAFVTTYYGEGSGVSLAIQQHPRRLAAQPMRIAVVGLGAGTIAALGETGDTIRFFEINSTAETFARRYFTFLSGSRATVSVVIGDARLSLERGLRDGSSAGAYDVVAVDAFAGDAIPVHLLTREAVALYLASMQPDGVLAIHVSNRYLDLAPVVRGLAREAGKQVLEVEGEDDVLLAIEGSTWMLVTGNETFVAGARSFGQLAGPDARAIVWTDAFSSLIPVLKRWREIASR